MFWEEKREPERGFENKDNVKEAFAKVKNDIFALGNELYSVKTELLDVKNTLSILNETINSLKIDILGLKSKPDFPTYIPTHEPKVPAYPVIPSNTPTVPVEIGGLKSSNYDTSTRNRGVPTDRQTYQQTDIYEESSVDEADFDTPLIEPKKPLKTHIQEAEDILNSLDNLKKEIRLKFKQLTSQEMLVFSTIYQLESEFPEGVEYRQIATKLRLSESSIRDYTQKLISKGIPVDKIKLNNKKILLKISSKLKNIAPLETLIKLREL
jgi:hypothetical protein